MVLSMQIWVACSHHEDGADEPLSVSSVAVEVVNLSLPLFQLEFMLHWTWPGSSLSTFMWTEVKWKFCSVCLAFLLCSY